VAYPFMASVEGYGIAGHEATHDFAQRCFSGAQKKMKVIGNERPSVALCFCFLKDIGKPLKE